MFPVCLKGHLLAATKRIHSLYFYHDLKVMTLDSFNVTVTPKSVLWKNNPCLFSSFQFQVPPNHVHSKDFIHSHTPMVP